MALKATLCMKALAGSTDFQLRNLGRIGQKQQNAVAVKQQARQQAAVSFRWLLCLLGLVDELKLSKDVSSSSRESTLLAAPIVLIRYPGFGFADTYMRRHKHDCCIGK